MLIGVKRVGGRALHQVTGHVGRVPLGVGVIDLDGDLGFVVDAALQPRRLMDDADVFRAGDGVVERQARFDVEGLLGRRAGRIDGFLRPGDQGLNGLRRGVGRQAG